MTWHIGGNLSEYLFQHKLLSLRYPGVLFQKIRKTTRRVIRATPNGSTQDVTVVAK